MVARTLCNCPECGKPTKWGVHRTEPYPSFIRRVRYCRECGYRIVTRERVAPLPVTETSPDTAK